MKDITQGVVGSASSVEEGNQAGPSFLPQGRATSGRSAGGSGRNAPDQGQERTESPCANEADSPSGGSLDSYRTTPRNSQKQASDDSDGDSLSECPNPVPGTLTKKRGGQVESWEDAPKPCGRKKCPYCGPRLRARYVAHHTRRFKQEIEEGRAVWFLNLTVDPKTEIEGDNITPEDSRKYVSHSWGKLRDRLSRRSDVLNYTGSFERQKGTRLWHMHILVAAGFEGIEDADLEGVKKMIREQAFGAGFGAVCKTKRVAEGRNGDIGEDGRPETLSGAVGYVVKYCLKDAMDAGQENKKRKSIVNSQGFGYNSKQAKENRRAYMQAKKSDGQGENPGEERQADSGQSEQPDGQAEPGPGAGEGEDAFPAEGMSVSGHAEGGELVEEWEPLGSGGGGSSGGFVDTITEEDRRRFEAADRSNATMRYEEKQENGRWRVYEYEKDSEEVSWVEYDKYPQADGAKVTARSSDSG